MNPHLSSSVQDIPRDHEKDVFNCYSTVDILGKSDVKILTVPTVRCYKHYRNERLNFILNVLMVSSLACAFSFGTGHFMGWSHRCRNVDNNALKRLALRDPDGQMKHDALKMLNSAKADCKQQYLEDFDVLKSIIKEAAEGSLCRKFIEEENHTAILVSKNFIENSLVSFDKSMSNAVSSCSENMVVNDSGINHKTKSDEIDLDIKGTVSKIREQQKYNTLNLNLNIMREFQDKVRHVSYKQLDLLNNFKQDIRVITNSLNSIFVLKSKFSDKDIKTIQNMHKKFEMNLIVKISELENSINDPLYEQNPQTFKKQFFSLIETVDGLLKAYMKSFRKNNEPVNKSKFIGMISKSLHGLEKKWGNHKVKAKDFRRKQYEKIEKLSKGNIKQGKKRNHFNDKIKGSYKKYYIKKYKY